MNYTFDQYVNWNTVKWLSANVNVIAKVVDFPAAGNLEHLKKYCSFLTEIGPKLGYHSEPTKIWLVVKLCVSEKVEFVFFGSKIKITTEDHKYLRGSVGTRMFKNLYITTKLEYLLVSWSYCQR